jgi:hypothetical protein
MNGIQPPRGILEIPGMKGKILIRHDLARGDVQVDFGGCDLRHAVQILLMAAQGAVAEWMKIDSKLIRTGGGSDQQEAGSKKADDDDDGGGAAV